MRSGALLLAALLGAAAAAGCTDPLHDQAVAALGDEDPNVPVGPLHRPGQPCLTCHASSGPAALQLGLAGTVFQDLLNVYPSAIPMAGATVTITDENGLVTLAETNCAGNFYVEHVDMVAAGVTFPLHVRVGWRDQGTSMVSHIGKETSCATCHVYVTTGPDGNPTAGVPSPSNVGQIYLNSDPLNPPPAACQ